MLYCHAACLMWDTAGPDDVDQEPPQDSPTCKVTHMACTRKHGIKARC